jgi:hypothetical protein
MTQFGRALHDLNIEIICAHSAPAKGRVERVHLTLQDRLVKEMRRAGVADIAAANAFLPGFMAAHNARFAKPPANPKDLHRPLAIQEDLDAAMVWREKRTVTAALTLHYNKMIFILEPNDVSRGLVRKQVIIHEYPDGRVQVRHDGIALPYRVFDKLRRVNQAAIVDNKHLGQTLAAIRDVQAKRGPGGATSRSAQERHMFIVPQPDAEEGRLAAAFALADAIKALEVPPRKQRGRLPLPRRPRDQ